MPLGLAIARRAIALTETIATDSVADRLTYWLNRLAIARLAAHRAAVPLDGGPLSVVPLSTHDLRNVALTGIYEPDVARFAQRIVRPGDFVVDVGAHIGFNTLLFASLVGPDGMVHSFDPDPGALGVLHQALELNRFAGRVILHEAAVGGSVGHTQLFLGAHGDVTNSTLPGWTQSADVRDVRLVTLDSILASCVREPFGLLKIDVEGAETAVLDGAHGLLSRTPPRAMIVEVTSRVDPGDVLSRLAQYGYGGWDEATLPRHTGAAVGERDFAYANVCAVHRRVNDP
jgi:FkbM family methyltransferase